MVTSKVSQARPPNLVKELNKNDGFSLSYRQLDCSGYSTIYRQLSPSSFGLVKGTTCFTHIDFYYLSCVAILSLTSAGYSTSTRNAVCIQPTVKQEVCGYCFISFLQLLTVGFYPVFLLLIIAHNTPRVFATFTSPHYVVSTLFFGRIFPQCNDPANLIVLVICESICVQTRHVWSPVRYCRSNWFEIIPEKMPLQKHFQNR